MYIKNFEELTLQDVPLVGGKNASLGQMIRDLSQKGVAVPGGFAITAQAYQLYMQENNLFERIYKLLKPIAKKSSVVVLQKAGKAVRALILKGTIPPILVDEITHAYKEMSNTWGEKNCSVAVRSSATAEDLPDASFAGQQETYLNVQGEKALLESYKKCLASLFTDRAIAYRLEKGFAHKDVSLSVGVQHMVRSDKASAGVMFTIDTESGFENSIVITSAYGLGESVVQGLVVPDEFHVFKPTLKSGCKPIIKKSCGSKKIRKIFGIKKAVLDTKVTSADQQIFSLSDKEILELARYGNIIEEHYSHLKGSFCPMDIEWAKDGVTKKLYIVQARPETVHAQQKKEHEIVSYTVKKDKKVQVLVEGQSIGQKIAQGKACIIEHVKDIAKMQKGDVLVTRITDPDWVPVMKKASAIITESGGRTCHAAIVSRELGIPALVGAQDAMKKIPHKAMITVDCSQGAQGYVYRGTVNIEKKITRLDTLPKLPVSLLVNIASPEHAYQTSSLPVDGVGLARTEFIVANDIQIHPMACRYPKKVSKTVQKEIATKTSAYHGAAEYFVSKLACGVATIAAAFYPRPVLVRFSDFKSNEYRGLLGGEVFEPQEENPMIGWRGASRYYSPGYAPAFELECQAIERVRKTMGLTNCNVMLPFVRTVEEAQKVLAIMKKYNLYSGKDGLQVYMMCELPSNVVLIEEFASYFDGFSIGSNDLTQTTLSVDRDSALLAGLFNEQDPAVIKMLLMALQRAQKQNKPIGICGQAPSDHPEIADFLIKNGITSLSLNPDSVLPFIMRFQKNKL